MSQAGEAQARAGWLRGTFRPHLLAPFFVAAGDAAQAGICPSDTAMVTIDFREPPEVEALSEQVKALVDMGLMMAEIAQQLNKHRSRITLAYRYWFESRGQPFPDGRTRRSTLIKKHLVPPLYQSIAEKVMQLAGEGLKFYEIGQRLNVDRNTVTQSFNWWHKQHGLSIPPGKGRRRVPPLDDTPPQDGNLDAA